MGHRTPLYEAHVERDARMVDFGGWDMPVHYGSQIEEHHAVRRDAGVFDVSHMRVVDLEGAQAQDFLRRLLANDVARLKTPGKALYSCMLRDDGGVIDDLIAYYRSAGSYRLVVNAVTADDDLAWIGRQSAGFEVSVTPRRDLAIVAVQGPQARRKAAACLDAECREAALELGVFDSQECAGQFVARTGYTGEDGFEIIMPVAQAAGFWRALVAIGVAPCGLGARDTLRLEAGMNLYGHDMDTSVTPFESGLAWTVALEGERDFIGKAALQAQLAAGVGRKLVGLILEGRGVLRAHQKVLVAGVGEGEVTSGSFSPTLERSIGLARVPAGAGDRVQVDIRGRLLNARVVKPPFVRNGKVMIEL